MAVAVGLFIVALDDEEMGLQLQWHVATENAFVVSYQRLYLYRSDNA